MENPEKIELFKQFNSDQEKKTYYIVALSVTAIGFAIVQTTGIELKYNQIPLGVAVLSWAGSVYCGMQFLGYRMSTNFANIELFNVHEGSNKEVQQNPELKEPAIEGITAAIESNSKIASNFSRWQNRLFYIGIATYILWHILVMYSLTKPVLMT
jgi:hypothetical protein